MTEHYFRQLKYNNPDDIVSQLEDMPEKEQLQGAFDGIVLLHETYNLNLTDLAAGDINIPGPLHNGKYNKIKSSYEFSATDLEFAGKHSYNLDYYDRAYEFIAAAIRKSKQKEEFKNQLKNIQNTLTIVKRDHDVTLIRKGSQGEDWRTFRLPFNKTLGKHKMFKDIRHRKHQWKPLIMDELQAAMSKKMSYKEQKRILKEQFNMLCRGEKLRNVHHDKSLQSFYLHHQNVYLKLGPLKLEIKSSAPTIVIFRDFFSQKEMSSFIMYAEPSLERSQHAKRMSYDPKKNNSSSRSRTSKQTWVPDYELEVARVVSRRISLATLQNSSAGIGGESYQVIMCEILYENTILYKT